MASYKVFNYVKISDSEWICDPNEPIAPYSGIVKAINYCESIGYSKEIKIQPEGVSYVVIEEFRDGKPTGNKWFFTK